MRNSNELEMPTRTINQVEASIDEEGGDIIPSGKEYDTIAKHNSVGSHMPQKPAKLSEMVHQSQEVSIEHKEEVYNEFLKATAPKGPGEEWTNFLSSEAVFTLDNKRFTGRELRRVILISEKNSDFNVNGFIRAYVFHLVFFLLGPIVGNMLMLILSCGNTKLIKNYAFWSANMYFMLQTMVWLGLSSSLFFYARMYHESLE
jgi:hypothetical protein